MSRYIDREARETGKQPSDSDSLFSDKESDQSDGELSDVIPLQNVTNRQKKRKSTALLESSDSDADNENSAPQRKKHKKSRKQPPSDNSFPLDTVVETNRLVKKLFSKMKHHESRLKDIEEKLKEATGSSSCATPSPKRAVKREVPIEVRVSNSSPKPSQAV